MLGAFDGLIVNDAETQAQSILWLHTNETKEGEFLLIKLLHIFVILISFFLILYAITMHSSANLDFLDTGKIIDHSQGKSLTLVTHSQSINRANITECFTIFVL